MSLPGIGDISLPGLSSLPPMTFGGGGPSDAYSRAEASTPLSVPFNFDDSGWNVNIKGQATQSAQGNTGANAGAAPSGVLGSLLGANWMPYALGGVVLLLLLRR